MWVPPIFRRATCYLQILKPHLAVLDFRKVVSLEPQNELVKGQLSSTVKLIRKAEFEKVGCVCPFAICGMLTRLVVLYLFLPGHRGGRREECSAQVL
jgi:hypothetical protein